MLKEKFDKKKNNLTKKGIIFSAIFSSEGYKNILLLTF
jgi:hypothetical protein